MEPNRDWPQQGDTSEECAAASRAAIRHFFRTVYEYLRDFACTDPLMAGLIVSSLAWILYSVSGVC